MEQTVPDWIAALVGLSDDPIRRAAQIALAAIDHALAGEDFTCLADAYDALQAALAD